MLHLRHVRHLRRPDATWRRSLPRAALAGLVLPSLVLAGCTAGATVAEPPASSIVEPSAAITMAPDPATSEPGGAGSSPSPSTPAGAGPSTASPSTPAATQPAPVLDQAWATVELTNVADGSTFRVADFAGRTIVLENMAIWCPKCRTQQEEAARAARRLGDDVVFVVLDVEPTEEAAALAAYARRHDFPFIYAVAPKAYSRAIAAEFGDLVLAPPTTPVWIIGRDGRVTFTERGIKSADELVELARAHGAS